MSKHFGVAGRLLSLAILALPAFAANYTLVLNPEGTKIQWTLKDVLHTVHGSFRLTQGRIEFDTATGNASGQVIVSAASGESGDGARDRRMHANVLESVRYPEATFVPSSFEGMLTIPGSSKIRVRGVLTIHGAPHDVVMDVQANSATSSQLHSVMSVEIPYVAWGMKDPSNFLLKVSKTVSVTIDASGSLQKQ